MKKDIGAGERRAVIKANWGIRTLQQTRRQCQDAIQSEKKAINIIKTALEMLAGIKKEVWFERCCECENGVLATGRTGFEYIDCPFEKIDIYKSDVVMCTHFSPINKGPINADGL